MSIDETIRNIKEYTKNDLEVFVDFSGGRYSLVLLHLVLKGLGKVKAVYIDTTISLPECNEFVDDICDKWGVELFAVRREDLNFWDLVKRWGFPHRRVRWCMRELKSIPLRLFNDAFEGQVLHLVGTSMHESSFRKKIYNVRGMYHYNPSIRSYVLHPLLKWTEEMIYDYIKTHNLPLNPCYEKYYGSGNCYYCPFITSLTYYLRLAALQPHLFSKIIEAEKAMRNKGGAIYMGEGKLLYLSKFSELVPKLVSINPEGLTLKECEARVMTKRLFTCQKRCLM